MTSPLRHLVWHDGKHGRAFHFKPSKSMRAAGWVGEALGTDEAKARARVELLNARWDKERASPEPELVRNIEAGTMEWLIDRFQKDPTWYKARAERTREQMDWAFALINEVFGKVPVRQVARKHLRAYYNEVRITGSATKAEKVMKWFHRLMEYAVENGVVDFNPAARMKIESPPNRTVIWTPDEIEAAIATALSEGKAGSGNTIPARPSVALAIAIAYDTSLPLGDVMALTWKAYDGEGLTVTQQKKRGQRKLYLPLTDRTRAMLDAQPKGGVQVVINEETGRPFTDRKVFNRVLLKVMSRAGITRRLTFHDIRRTALTELGARGATNAEIAAYSGHSVNSPILNTYVQRTRETVISAFRKREKKT